MVLNIQPKDEHGLHPQLQQFGLKTKAFSKTHSSSSIHISLHHTRNSIALQSNSGGHSNPTFEGPHGCGVRSGQKNQKHHILLQQMSAKFSSASHLSSPSLYDIQNLIDSGIDPVISASAT